jgi:hypothetical protein
VAVDEVARGPRPAASAVTTSDAASNPAANARDKKVGERMLSLLTIIAFCFRD